MIKQLTVLEEKIGERTYQLSCSSDSPLGELHDALMLMKGYCVERMVAAQKEEQDVSDQMKQEEKQDGCSDSE